MKRPILKDWPRDNNLDLMDTFENESGQIVSDGVDENMEVFAPLKKGDLRAELGEFFPDEVRRRLEVA